MKRIRQIRGYLHQLISAIAVDDREKITSGLVMVNPLIGEALSRVNLEFTEAAFKIILYNPLNLMSPVWVILKSLYELLTVEDRIRIKECPTCGWVFFDETKNGKRRWCNPVNCGAKDKMSRYHQKLREENKKNPVSLDETTAPNKIAF